MKKIVILLACFVFSAILSYGQNTKRVTLEFNAEDFEFQQDEAGCFVILSGTHNYHFKSDTLQPALPFLEYNVLISNTEGYSSHSVSESKILIRNNVDMAHNPVELPTNMPAPMPTYKRAPSYSQETYPNVNVEFAGTNEGGGYKLLSFHICPFEYDAQNRKLYLKTKIIIDIKLNNGLPISSTSAQNVQSSSLKEQIRQIVVNPEDIEYDEVPKRSRTSDAELTLQTGYEYVIVTSNQLKSAFQALADWKNRKGIRSKVITVENIMSTYTGLPKPEKIKRALADIDGLSYVLLGGDTLNVPTCMCFIGIQSDTSCITPADSYYACLGTMNWDANGNGLYGDTIDNVSLLPSLNVSRAPVATIEDAQTFVNRIIGYESAPDTTDWEDNILMGGKSLGYKVDNQHHDYYFYNYYTTGDSVSDTQHWSQTIYDTYINPSNASYPSWDGDRVRLYDTHSDVSVSGNYIFTYSNLQTEMSKGYTFVDIMTHGWIYAWTVEGNSYYEWGHANRLNNAGYTIVTTTACSTNAFDFNTIYHNHGLWCLSQHFIQNPQSGVLAYWGTSRENWYTPRTLSLGPGAIFDGLTYRKLFEDRYHRMGKATTAVKIEKMSSATGGYSSARKVWMGLNLMGDPEMPVYLSKPKSFQSVNIKFVNDNVYVDAGTDGFDICFINQADSTEYYIAREIDNSSVSFSGLCGIYDVCITKPGYIPYTAVCGDSLYLQNITLTGTKSYVTDNAMIGSNVTAKVSQGPVVVSNGITTITANQRAVITKDFEVTQGAQFIIKNE